MRKEIIEGEMDKQVGNVSTKKSAWSMCPTAATNLGYSSDEEPSCRLTIVKIYD